MNELTKSLLIGLFRGTSLFSKVSWSQTFEYKDILALGDGPGRVYVVEPVSTIENDPNLTDKKFPGNPTNSFRAKDGFKVVGEVKDWQGHSSEEIKTAREKVDLALKNGAPIIED